MAVRPDDIAACTLLGGDVEIAAAALVVRLSQMDPDASGQIIPHVRMSAGAMTLAEAQAWRNDPAREAEIAATEKAAEGGGDAMEPDARRAAWGTIIADVTADLKATGLYKDADARAQAQVVAVRTILRAEQRGMNPLDLWAEERAKIEGPEAKPTKTAPPFGADDLALWQDMGEPAITAEISAAICRQAGPIRLQMGDEKAGLNS